MTSSESSGEKETKPKKRERAVTKKPSGKTLDDEETDNEMPLDEHDPLGKGHGNDDDPDDNDASSGLDPANADDPSADKPVKRPAANLQKKPATKRSKKNALEDIFQIDSFVMLVRFIYNMI